MQRRQKNELEDRRNDWISKGETTMHKYINEEINKNIAVFELEKAYMNLFDKKDYFPIIYVDSIRDTITIDKYASEYTIYTVFAINKSGYVRILCNVVNSDYSSKNEKHLWRKIKKEIYNKSYKNTSMIFANLPPSINYRRKNNLFSADVKPAFLENLYISLKDIQKDNHKRNYIQAYENVFTATNKEEALRMLNLHRKVDAKQYLEGWEEYIENFIEIFECPVSLRHAIIRLTQISKFHKMYDEMSKSYTTKESFENALRMISEESIKKEYMIPIHFWQKILNELKNEI